MRATSTALLAVEYCTGYTCDSSTLRTSICGCDKRGRKMVACVKWVWLENSWLNTPWSASKPRKYPPPPKKKRYTAPQTVSRPEGGPTEGLPGVVVYVHIPRVLDSSGNQFSSGNLVSRVQILRCTRWVK